AMPVIRHRLYLQDQSLQGVDYGEPVTINGVRFSLHPAGHIPGSAQIRVEYHDEVWVFSGDYKLHDDGISTPFEPQKWHVFVTESTIGLPVDKWKESLRVIADINEWWTLNRNEGRASLITGYALSKSQRSLKNVDASIGPIFTHGAV